MGKIVGMSVLMFVLKNTEDKSLCNEQECAFPQFDIFLIYSYV
jgi:hypothetical protein